MCFSTSEQNILASERVSLTNVEQLRESQNLLTHAEMMIDRSMRSRIEEEKKNWENRFSVSR